MHIVFFTHYFPPEGNAPASRTYEHCVRWVKKGHQITVITCVPNVPSGIVYDGYRNRFWPQREMVDGIDVLRVWTWVAPNAGGTQRILNFVSYLMSAVIVFLFFCSRPQAIVATSPQFFCGWAGVIASWLKWRPLILEIRDIWPESITTVGAMRKGMVTRVLEWLEKLMYRSAKRIVAVGNGYRDNIVGKIGQPQKVAVVTNGVDTTLFSPRVSCESLRASWGMKDRFVCSYVGTIGLAHGLEVMVEAAQQLKHNQRQDIGFVIVGDGAKRAELEALVSERGLQNQVYFTGRIDKSKMPDVIASSNCLLVHLKKTELFETVIPSKIFEAMAMERPIIMGVRGEAATIVEASGCGIMLEPENAKQLAEIVVAMADDSANYRQLGSSSREFVIQYYSRDHLALAMINEISKAIKSN